MKNQPVIRENAKVIFDYGHDTRLGAKLKLLIPRGHLNNIFYPLNSGAGVIKYSWHVAINSSNTIIALDDGGELKRSKST